MRADAAVDRGNTLASWAELAAPAEAAKLLASAVASYSEALRQEEDAVVRSKLSRKLPSKLPAYLSQCRDLLLLPGAGYGADPGAGYWADPGAVFKPTAACAMQRTVCPASSCVQLVSTAPHLQGVYCTATEVCIRVQPQL